MNYEAKNMSEKWLPVDEVMIHVHLGEQLKAMGSMHVMSYDHFKKVERSLQHYLETGEITHSKQWDTYIKTPVDNSKTVDEEAK